jgi:hypothetical protein
MSALRLFALLVYTFGAFTYGALLVLWVRELGRVGWAGRIGRQVEVLNGALTVVSFLWFSGLIWQMLMFAGSQRPYWPLELGLVAIAYAFPPLIMHLTWAEVTQRRPTSRAWAAVLVVSYVAAAGIPLVTIWAMTTASGDLVRPAMRVLGAGLPVLFIVTAVYCIALVSRQPQAPQPQEKAATWAMRGLFALMLLLFVATLAVSELQGGMHPTGYAAVGSVVEVIAKSLPLIFVFVSAYFESRFQFFDLFVKRGSSLLATLAALTLWFSITLPLLMPLSASPAAPWLFAVAVLPVAALTPWLYGRIGRLLDRRWLGRRYSTSEAVTRFLTGLRSATSELEAVARAEECLAEIFRAPARVEIGERAPSPAFDVRHECPVPTGEGTACILLGPRLGNAPYFSQDTALVRSLAGVFAPVLDNLRLQQRRHTEEQRARELSLIASQAELKALRAQIDPHFLFNALNAIAGLLHQDPATADRTIEQLAEVFRYTLRRSNSEWAILADEVEFIQAYLDVERARFGERLAVRVDVAPDVRRACVPTMMLQTLVENAVKHGVSEVLGPARLGVDVRLRNGRVEMTVSDNGPRFDAGSAAGEGPGYGLVNIRQRLAGYYGDAATLEFSRDDTAGWTSVTVALPLTADEPAYRESPS